MYIKYITYNFSTVIGPNVCDSWNTTKQKEIGKIMQCPFIKSPSLYMVMVFLLQRNYYYAFIVKQMKKNTF